MDFLDKSCHQQLPLRKNSWALQRKFLGDYILAAVRNYSILKCKDKNTNKHKSTTTVKCQGNFNNFVFLCMIKP